MFSATTKFNFTCLVFLLLATNVELRFISNDSLLLKIPGGSGGGSDGGGPKGNLGLILNHFYLSKLKEILKHISGMNVISKYPDKPCQEKPNCEKEKELSYKALNVKAEQVDLAQKGSEDTEVKY